MATARALTQRCVRAWAAATPTVQQCVGPFASQGDRFAARVNSAVEEPGVGVREHDMRHSRTWNAKWLAAGAFSLSFAASTVSVAFGKELVADRFAPQEVVLYQYDACPFCNKVKAFLDYHDIAYKVVEVNPMGKKEIKWSEYKKVPILVVDGEALNDSTAIITELTRRIEGDSASALAQEPGYEEEQKWRSWVDEHLVHLLSPNIYRTPREALQAFDYLTTSADEWVKALDGRQFMGGSKPNLADLAVFGVLRPIRHLDTGRDLMDSTNIGEWYARMEDAVGATARLQEPLMGTSDQPMKAY